MVGTVTRTALPARVYLVGPYDRSTVPVLRLRYLVPTIPRRRVWK